MHKRRKTFDVKIGSLMIGCRHEVAVQSMVNTDPLDTRACISQAIKIIEAGGQLVRFAVPGIKEAENLATIKKGLLKMGYNTPLVADVHFNPAVAETAAAIVEKVRINPGNFADNRKSFAANYSDREYSNELERIYKRLLPLLDICRTNGTALRIGVNHGSLSQRIVFRYGDTPEGMAESALEFLRICRSENFNQVVVSLKSSNTRIMVFSTRLLVNKMDAEGLLYPVHLGVTEAGDFEDGQIRSAAGIGTLLADGIGDTIRVSLTAPPEKEIPVAKKLVSLMALSGVEKIKKKYAPLDFSKRKTYSCQTIGSNQHPVVIAGPGLKKSGNKIFTGSLPPDFLYLSDLPDNLSMAEKTGIILPYKKWMKVHPLKNLFPVFSAKEYLASETVHKNLNFLIIKNGLSDPVLIKKILSRKDTVILFYPSAPHFHFSVSSFILTLQSEKISAPVIICFSEKMLASGSDGLSLACYAGPAFIDGLADGIMFEGGKENTASAVKTSFSLLQSAGARVSGPFYISCPTCGRTKFDLTAVLADIKNKTGHMKGVRIAVMGCIVNGPGEMADADFGYVGCGRGKVAIYRGKKRILNNVPASEAVSCLLELIQKRIK